MWALPGPGIEPVSPALAGGFLTTVPPGKSQDPEDSFDKQNKHSWSRRGAGAEYTMNDLFFQSISHYEDFVKL